MWEKELLCGGQSSTSAFLFFFFHNCGSCYENAQISCCFNVYKAFFWCVTVFKSLNAACYWYSGIFSDCSDVTSW